jgi:hypothetical protein
MPRGVSKRYMKSRKKSYSVYLRPFIRETIAKKMSVEKALAFLDEKTKEYHRLYD